MAGSAVLILVILLLVVGVGAAFLLLGSGGSSTPLAEHPDGKKAVVVRDVNQWPGFNDLPALKALYAVDSGAKQIWVSVEKANSDGNNTYIFERFYDSKKDKELDAILYVACDDEASYDLNNSGDEFIYKAWNATLGKAEITLKPGRNVLRITAKNIGGGAGLAYTVTTKGGSVLFHSDNKTYIVSE